MDRTALAALSCMAFFAGAAHAQVSTFTREGGGGAVAFAPLSERPASRVYLGRAYVNAHQDVRPGVADALAPASESRRGAPLAYGASPTLEGVVVATNLGPTAVFFDPWSPIEGGGQLATFEARRQEVLERYGLLLHVRTHRNDAAAVLSAAPEAAPRPAAPVATPAGDVREGDEIVSAG